nr:hypothetical protein [Saccharomonospora sp. CUA-673]
MACPVRIEPVNAIFATSGCSASACPVSPSPYTMLTTPAGIASATHSDSSCAEPGVYSDGFSTIVQPAAVAPASFQPASSIG